MPTLRRSSFAAKFLTVAAIGMLLSLGLCKLGTPFMGHGNHFQDAAATIGILLFIPSFLGIPLGVLMMIISAIRGYD